MMIAFGSKVEEIKTEFTSPAKLPDSKSSEQSIIEADGNFFLDMSGFIHPNRDE